MIFSLDVRRARKGDCLMLHFGTGDDPGLVMIDGGPKAVYEPFLKPRLIQIRDINMDAEFAPHMLFVINADKPGMIGRLGTLLGDAKVNIASFALGRSEPGADAIALLEVDGGVDENVLGAIRKLPNVKQANALRF